MLVAGPTRVMNIIISGATCIKASVARTVLVNVLFRKFAQTLPRGLEPD